jgi:general stress protein 26
MIPGLLACHAPDPPAARSSVDAVPVAELYKVADDTTILRAARALMVTDSFVAVTTVDSTGQPRVRSTKAFVNPVDPADPARGVTVWIMTRLGTRKVDQIRRHPQVTLYFNDDARTEYATIMGTAVVHTDPDNPDAKRFYEDGYSEFFWPDFPRDFVMIEVKPKWLEYLGPDVPGHKDNWRPQAVTFK